MLFLTSILLLSLQCATSTPQLRLSHTGYEIISFDDQTPDDSLPAATKLPLQNASRHNSIGVPNLEKAESVEDETESLVLPVEQHKRHYDLQRATDAKTISQIRRNTIDASAKGFSSVPSEKKNTYLAVGIPTRSEHPSRRTKEFSNVLAASETSANVGSKNSLDESHEEGLTWANHPKIDKKKTKKATKMFKQSIANQLSDKVSTIFNSDFDSSDSKEDSKYEKITALVADAHRAFDQIDAKTDSEGKQEKIDANSAFPTLGKLPSIQIHRQKSFYLPSKSPTMFSPIYPSGFDIAARNFFKKSILSINEPSHIHPTSLQSDSKYSKNRKYADGEFDAHKKLSEYEIKEIGNGAKEFVKSHQRNGIPSLMMLKNILNNVKHDAFNSKNINRLPLSGVFPVAATSLYVSPLSLMFQRPSRPLRLSEQKHLELNSMPLVAGHIERNNPNGVSSVFHPQGRLEDIVINSVSNAPKTHLLDNYLDNKYGDPKITNNRIQKSESSADFFRNFLEKIHNLNLPASIRSLVVNQPAKELALPNSVSSKGGLVIDVIHETAPDVSEEMVFDNNKGDAANEVHGMQDTLQASSSHSSMSSCKRMKPITPPFYHFLAKFSDIILESAQQYESSLQHHDSAAKVIDGFKNKNSENTSNL